MPPRLLLCVVWAAAACGAPSTSAVETEPGSHLPGLTEAEVARFTAGKRLFEHAFTSREGLGPLYNQTGCGSCHDLPAAGGHGAEPVRKATRFDPASGCSLLPERGGDLLQASVTPAGRALGLAPEQVPVEATGAADILPPSLYGLGLVAAVPISAIRALADPEDRDGDGISGRLGTAPDGTPGLFGRKATEATLDSFIEGATNGELGLTTPAHPAEQLPQGRPLPEGADPAPEPEVDTAFLAGVTDFVRFLAPPPPHVPDTGEGRAAAARGRRLFAETGCASCHTPSWTTGYATSPALRGKRFRAYSDFLLHDMGPDLADICAPGASPSEWRTARLVGLSLRRVFLHDGRAGRLEEAIGLHGGEAARARDAFRALSPEARRDLIRFLQTL